jgi:hypothetical protein
MGAEIVPVLLACLNFLGNQTGFLLGFLQCGEGSPNPPTVEIKGSRVAGGSLDLPDVNRDGSGSEADRGERATEP